MKDFFMHNTSDEGGFLDVNDIMFEDEDQPGERFDPSFPKKEEYPLPEIEEPIAPGHNKEFDPDENESEIKPSTDHPEPDTDRDGREYMGGESEIVQPEHREVKSA